MRLSFLSAFPPYRGGISRFSAELVMELRRTHDVSAFTFTRQYPGLLFPGSSQFDGTAADNVHAERSLDSIGPFTWTRTANAMLARTPDVAVLRFWMPFFGPSFGWVGRSLRQRGVKVISIVDNAIPHETRFFDRAFTKYFMSGNDAFISLSGKVTADLHTLQPSARVCQLFHPLYDHFGTPLSQAEARSRMGIPANKKVVLYFGFIRDYKGLDLLIEAMARTPEDHLLIIAGEPYGDMVRYNEAMDRCGVRGRIVDRMRYITEDEVPALFGSADVVVLPYRSGTQSGITAMAYHFGTPIIATDVGGLKESVEHDRTGLVVPVPTAEAIAEALNRFFTEGRAPVYRANIAALREQLSWKRFADQLVDFAGTL